MSECSLLRAQGNSNKVQQKFLTNYRLVFIPVKQAPLVKSESIAVRLEFIFEFNTLPRAQLHSN